MAFVQLRKFYYFCLCLSEVAPFSSLQTDSKYVFGSLVQCVSELLSGCCLRTLVLFVLGSQIESKSPNLSTADQEHT